MNDDRSVPSKPPRSARLVTVGALVVWAAAVALGLGYLATYRTTPSRAAVLPAARWPSGVSIPLDPAIPTLVMIVHPKCPCSRASIAELAKLCTKAQGRTAVHVVFVKPHGVGPEWEKTDLLARAREVPGANVLIDEGGREASMFGAFTSGQTYVFAPDGRALFAGGITDGRGHQGDNAGEEAVLALISGKTSTSLESTNVYGCELGGPDGPQAKAGIANAQTLPIPGGNGP